MTQAPLHSRISGPETAPPLLLLNSLGATMEMWEPQLSRLESQYRVIRCDTRGHGESLAPDGPYSLDDLVADAIALLDRHEVETARVMGVSLGGMTALGLGLTAPERIEGIVCCAARADAPPPFVQNWHDRLALLESGGIAAVWEATADKWLSAETRAAHPEREAALREGFLKTSPTGYRGCAEALQRLDYLRHLPEMTVPVLYVAGAEDMAAPAAAMRQMAETTPGAGFAEVAGAAHILNVDRPGEFLLAIAGFLDLLAD